jgi:DNA-binding NarL/FixJ family response regulator
MKLSVHSGPPKGESLILRSSLDTGGMNKAHLEDSTQLHGDAKRSTIGVYVICRTPLWRRGLELLVVDTPDFCLVGSASSLDDAIESGPQVSGSSAVSLVHLDRNVLVSGGWLVEVADLRAAFPHSRLVAIHPGLSSVDVGKAGAAGIDTLVDETSNESVLVRAIRDPLQRTLQRWEPSTVGPTPLTPRETDVLRLIAEGLTSREIAEKLNLSHRTVENYKQRICRRLGVQSQAQAVSTALRFHLILPMETQPMDLPSIDPDERA